MTLIPKFYALQYMLHRHAYQIYGPMFEKSKYTMACPQNVGDCDFVDAPWGLSLVSP